MNLLTRLGLFLLLALGTAARAADLQDPAAVAIAALEAMNNSQGEQYVALAHPDLMKQMRDSIIAKIVDDLNRGRVSPELAALGVNSLDQAKALPAETVTRVTIERMRDKTNAALKERMRTAKFRVVNSAKEDANTQRLTVALDMKAGDTPQTQTFDVRVKKAGGVWKFGGPAQTSSPITK